MKRVGLLLGGLAVIGVVNFYLAFFDGRASKWDQIYFVIGFALAIAAGIAKGLIDYRL